GRRIRRDARHRPQIAGTVDLQDSRIAACLIARKVDLPAPIDIESQEAQQWRRHRKRSCNWMTFCPASGDGPDAPIRTGLANTPVVAVDNEDASVRAHRDSVRIVEASVRC